MQMMFSDGSSGVVHECDSDDDNDVNAYERQPRRDKGVGGVKD